MRSFRLTLSTRSMTRPGRVVAAAALLLTATSCGDPAEPEPEVEPTYEVFAAGADNVFMGYDGEEWSLITTTPSGRDFHAMRGTAVDDLYLGVYYSAVHHFDGDSLTELTAGWNQGVEGTRLWTVREFWSTGDELWVAGSFTLASWDGTSWTTRHPDPPILRSIWGSAPDDIFVVGQEAVLHWDGVAWDTMTLPDIPPVWERGWLLEDVWGASPTDVFAVGTPGFYRYDGTEWHRFDTSFQDESGFEPIITAVDGTSPTDVFATDQDGGIYHYDGVEWSRMETCCPGVGLIDVYARSPTDVWAVGTSATVLHYDGVAWTRMETPLQGALARLHAVWAP